MLKTASEVVASGDLRAAVDYAIEANREVSSAKRQLDSIKAHLRKKAREVWDTEGDSDYGVELTGNLGVAFVSFPKPESRPKSGQDLRNVEANLAPETFAKLFTREVVVKPVKNFPELLDSLSEAEQAVVARFVEVVDPTPKVNLPK